MADRKASVALELQAGQFKAEAIVVEKKVDDIDDKVEKLDRDITKIPADAAKAGAAMKLLGGDVGSVGDKIGSLGEKSTGLAVLDAKIKASRGEVRKLADEFVRTGDVDVFRKLGDAEGRLRGLHEVRKKLASALVDGADDAGKVVGKTLAKSGTEAGGEFAKLFTSGLSGGLSTPVLGPILIAALAAVAVPAGIAVGAAVGGALLTGIGAAAAGGGLAGAWLGDPDKYSREWNASIDKVQHRWLASSDAFGNELEDTLRTVDQMLNNLPVEKILAISQGFVDPLVGGAAGGITAAAEGLADALGHVQPIIDRIGPELAELGHDVGDAFRMIAAGSDQGGQALGDLIDVIGFLVRATATMILGFELAYGALRDLVTGMADFGQSIPVIGTAAQGLWDSMTAGGKTITSTGKMLGDTGTEALNAAWRFGDMIKAGVDLATAAFAANDALTALHNTLLASANANLAVAQGWLDLKKGLEDGARVLDTTSQAGIDNNKVIIEQVGLLEQQRQQAIKTGGGTVDAINAANAAYNEGIARMRAMAIAAGFDAAQVDRLIAALGGVQPVTTAAVVTPGLSAALAQGVSLGNALNRIDGQVYEANVYVNYHTQGQSLNAPQAHGGIRHAAVGMIIPPSNPGTLVGEPQTGGEALIPLQGISQMRAMGLAQTVGNSYGFRVVPNTAAAAGRSGPLTMAFAGATTDPLNQLIMREVQSGRIQLFVDGQPVTAR